jgi:hypothetical protein
VKALALTCITTLAPTVCSLGLVRAQALEISDGGGRNDSEHRIAGLRLLRP